MARAANVTQVLTNNTMQTVFKWMAFIVLGYITLRLIRRSGFTLFDPITNLIDPTVDNLLDTTTPNDNSQGSVDNSFRPTARAIAESQLSNMQSSGTDEEALFNAVLPLNGTQLRMVYEEFGQRQGKTLFQWYDEELCDSFTCGSLVYNDAQAGPDCDSYLDQCRETSFMRAIWQKSGLPITF